MRRILMVLSIAALMATMLVAFATPAFADYESDFWKGYFECYADNNCLMQDTPPLQVQGTQPFAVDNPDNCPAGTMWAPTSDPKYGGAKYVCE